MNEVIDLPDLMQVAGRVAVVIDRHDPAMVFVDGTGIGANRAIVESEAIENIDISLIHDVV